MVSYLAWSPAKNRESDGSGSSQRSGSVLGVSWVGLVGLGSALSAPRPFHREPTGMGTSIWLAGYCLQR